MNRVNGELTSYSYSELTKMRRELQKEIKELKIKLEDQEKYAELGRLALAAHLEDKKNVKDRELGTDSFSVEAYMKYLGAMNEVMEDLINKKVS